MALQTIMLMIVLIEILSTHVAEGGFCPQSPDQLKRAIKKCVKLSPEGDSYTESAIIGGKWGVDQAKESSRKSLIVYPEKCKDYSKLSKSDGPIVHGTLHGLGLDTEHPIVNVKKQSKNYLVAVLHKAFTAHLPITLRPDDIWLTILQGLAIHVNMNADTLRGSILKDASGNSKRTLLVRDDRLKLGDVHNDWSHVFGSFTSQIAEQTVNGTMDVLDMGFTTSTPTTVMAGQCVIFKVLSSYFDYHTITMCGIPEVFLKGTPYDWELLRKKVELLRAYDLDWWMEHLEPICDEFVLLSYHLHEQKELSSASRRFWSSIYHYESLSGGPKVTGWVNTLFPYLTSTEKPFFERNANIDWKRQDFFHGISPGAFPPGYTKAPMKWTYYGRDIDTQMNAGFFGSAQNPKTFALEPVIGWCVSEGEITLK